MRKLFLIALVAIGLLVTGAAKSEARVFVNIGVGFPVAYYPYPYAYYPAYPVYYAPPVYVGYRPYYWWSGRPLYYRHHCW